MFEVTQWSEHFRWILSLEPERLKNPTATVKEISPGWNGLSARGAQAACCFKCWASVAVGIPVAWYPPHGSVHALVSAYGSYLG